MRAINSAVRVPGLYPEIVFVTARFDSLMAYQPTIRHAISTMAPVGAEWFGVILFVDTPSGHKTPHMRD